MADNKQLASDVLEAVGGKENVTKVIHCMTRLRFNLVDDSVPNDDEVKAIKGVLGIARQGGMYQVIIGTTVPEVYDELTQLGVGGGGTIDENLDEAPAKFTWTPKNVLDAVLNYLSGSVVPLVPILMTAGLFKTLGAVFGPTFLNLVPADDPFVFLCDMIYNAGFYFMPIFAGFTASQKLGANPYLGALVGAILLEPSFAALVGGETGLALFGFNVPIPLFGYGQTLIPVLLCIPVYAFLEKKINAFMPAAVRTVFGPFLTILIMVPLELFFLAPLGSMLGNGVAALFELIGNSPLGFLAIAIFAATYPMLVLTGMHIGIMGIAIANFGNVGSDSMFLMASTVQNFTASGVGLAVALKMRDPENRSLCWGYFLTQFLGGVGEPLLYGVFLRYKRPWIGTLCGGAAAGLYAGFTHVTLYTMASGLFSPLAFAGGDQGNFINGCIAMGIGAVVAFVTTWFFGLTKEQAEGKE
ncbi:MAG: PTS transporter subunit EIIC [Coriobacteriales bacterium]|nr:PTS transporter subunit EIIC [Coriobacteriales bacterium]